MFLAVTLSVIIVFILIYQNFYKPLQLWKVKGVAHEKPWLFIGNMIPVVFKNKFLPQHICDLYSKYEDKRYFGFYQFSMPSLVIRDPELIKTIAIKEFDKFMDHSDFLPAQSDPFWKKVLFSRTGKEWKDLRYQIMPAFSNKAHRDIFEIVKKTVKADIDFLSKRSTYIELDMHDFYNRVTNDIIASYLFGIECNSIKDPNNELYKMAEYTFTFTGIKYFKFLGYSISPTLMNMLKVTVFDKKSRNYFENLVDKTLRNRINQNVVQKDLLHYLKDAQKNSGLTNDDVVIQSMGFYFANYEAFVSLISNLSYELAVNSIIQDKVVEEIDVLWEKYEGNLDFDSLSEAKYLDMVVSETLRLRTSSVIMNRMCTKEFTVEPKNSNENPLSIEPGTDITIPLYSLVNDEKYFPNPQKFDPERFSDENKLNIERFAYIPFGAGPRQCIGNRLTIMQAKVLTIHLLRRFRFVPTEKTPTKFTPNSRRLTLMNADGYWLRLERRNNVDY